MANTNTMNTRIELIQIQKLINEAQLRMSALVDSQPKPQAGKPPQPRHTQRVEMGLWRTWEVLKSKENFTAAQARKIAGEKDIYLARRSESAYSSILSRWAREGCIDFVEQGKGPRPSTYKIPN
jgi:hypothetical protein